MGIVTEKLLHQESKLNEKVPTPLEESRKSLISQSKGYKKPKPLILLVTIVKSQAIARKIVESFKQLKRNRPV